jgi:uncharacterized protein
LGKLLFIIAAFFIAWWILRGYRRSLMRDKRQNHRAVEDMVRCAHCGVHLPRSESRMSAGKLFCCEEHANRGG